jgi:prophage tail gpP-like protein
MTLNGESPLDTITLRVLGLNVEIENFTSYSVTSSYNAPASTFQFTVPDPSGVLGREVLKPLAKVQIFCNGRPQLTGYIGDATRERSRGGGTVVQIAGRDILGAPIDACVNPYFKLSERSTALDAVLGVLAPFGIRRVYNADALNVSAMTGNSAKLSSRTTNEAVSVAFIAIDDQGQEVPAFEEIVCSYQRFANRRDLKAVPLTQLKPRENEGCIQFLQRILERLGFRMWAAADGSGVVVATPDFDGDPRHKIELGPTNSDCLDFSVKENTDAQPGVIILRGNASGTGTQKEGFTVIQINELVGLGADGQPHQYIKRIIAQNKGARVLPLRPQLIPPNQSLSAAYRGAALFTKDDEARTIEQLEAACRKKMMEFQIRGYEVRFVMRGLTQNQAPWAVNTMVSVVDDKLGISRNLWLAERTFSKSKGGGTTTSGRLVLPYTAAISA